MFCASLCVVHILDPGTQYTMFFSTLKSSFISWIGTNILLKLPAQKFQGLWKVKEILALHARVIRSWIISAVASPGGVDIIWGWSQAKAFWADQYVTEIPFALSVLNDPLLTDIPVGWCTTVEASAVLIKQLFYILFVHEFPSEVNKKIENSTHALSAWFQTKLSVYWNNYSSL